MKRLGIAAVGLALVAGMALACGGSGDEVEQAVNVAPMAAAEAATEEAEQHYNKDVALGEEARWEEAIREYDEAIELEPSDVVTLALAYFNRSYDLAGLGRHEEAEPDRAKACELGLDDAC